MSAHGKLLRRAARAGGFNLVRRNFYSPLVDVDEVPKDAFDRKSPLAGIDWDMRRYEAFLRDLRPLFDEFTPPAGYWDNVNYGPVETEVVHALIRRERPSQIVELGSGFSSLAIAAACLKNARDGSPCRYRAFDPYPLDFVADGLTGMDALQPVGVCDVPSEVFAALEAGDILFIDTTHTVKVGSDVNRLILDVLPTLKPGVIIHVHDIFLPYEYPRDFLVRHCYWQEQYLLQALLAENPNFEIVFPAWAFVHERPDIIGELFPQHDGRVFGPGAFWLRRVQG